MSPTNDGLIWAVLWHLGYNMWSDREVPEWKLEHIVARSELRFDETLWNDLLPRAVAAGVNMVVLDLGEGIQYRSHPELAVAGSWSSEKLQQELARLRQLGLEPIPKLNFSACHDLWLGPYARMLSTPVYYDVCRDVIAEVLELFGHPRFFHLGMDEETAEHQRYYEYIVVRQYDLWWHDLLHLVEQVERGGARAWVWSDYVWQHPQWFYKRMPHSVLQSNWYYGRAFGPDAPEAQAYLDLEQHGYDQVPTGSNWSYPDNLSRTVRYCQPGIARARLKGFMQTVWKPTLESCRQQHMQALDLLGEARRDLAALPPA